jgi:hypothetical protein
MPGGLELCAEPRRKLGGRKKGECSSKFLKDFMFDEAAIDLGFHGAKFTGQINNGDKFALEKE